jgi:hypothetical protein
VVWQVAVNLSALSARKLPGARQTAIQDDYWAVFGTIRPMLAVKPWR